MSQMVPSNAYAQQYMAGHAMPQSGYGQNLPPVNNANSQNSSLYASPWAPYCSPSGSEPASYYPYSTNVAAAYDSSYPNMESAASKFPTGCGQSAGYPCGQNYQLNINSLMPQSWKSPSAMASGNGTCQGSPLAAQASQTEDTQWARMAPSKKSFNNYITASGSARLSMNSRTPIARQTGIPLLLRSQPGPPLSTNAFTFNDSSIRQDMVFNTVGAYSMPTSC